jgi:hypothetical protein
MGLSAHLSGIGSHTRFNVVIETATLINLALSRTHALKLLEPT